MKFKVTNGPKWLKSYTPKLRKLFDKYFENLLGNSWVSVNFVSKEQIRELSSRFRKLHTGTDVLSFPFVFVDAGEPVDEEELGEIYISEEITKENAKEYKVSYREELVRVFIHGTLHVLGYDHVGTLNNPDIDDKEMFEMQEFLVKEVFRK